MHFRLPSLLLSGALFLGCGTDGADKPPAGPDSEDHADDGADSSEAEEETFEDGFDWGEAEPCSVESCQREADEYAARLEAPDLYRTDFTSAACVAITFGAGGNKSYGVPANPADYRGPVACRCAGEPDPDADYFLHREPNGPDCAAHGRNGACLYRRADFPGCDVTEAHSCDNLCAGLQGLLNLDEVRVFDAEVRAVRCLAEYDCGYVIEAEGSCTVNGWFPQACSASDDEMFSAYAEADPF
jgi:hypothetical protein